MQSFHKQQHRLVYSVAGHVPTLHTLCQPPVPRPCTPCSAAAPDTSTSGPAYPYNGGDTRQKATIEHVFQPAYEDSGSTSTSSSSSSSEQTPWSVGWQMNERNIVWSDDLKLRLIKHVAAQELGLSGEELEQRLADLDALLPGLSPQLARAPAPLVARLAANTDQIAQRLLALKLLFPEADLTAMVSKRFSLLLSDDMTAVAAAASRLKQLLPSIHMDYFVEAHPSVLDVEDFERALEDAARIMPGVDVAQMLRQNPDLVLSLQKGKNLIEYDQIANPFS